MELDPKIWDLGIFSDLCTFFGMAKNEIHIENSFNVYNYLKSTRKELSDIFLLPNYGHFQVGHSCKIGNASDLTG